MHLLFRIIDPGGTGEGVIVDKCDIGVMRKHVCNSCIKNVGLN